MPSMPEHPLPVNAKIVPGFPDYCVTVGGKLFSRIVHGSRPRRLGPWHELKGRKSGTVSLFANGKAEDWKIPELVLLTFTGPRPPVYKIKYLDGNRRNWCVSNLAYEKQERYEDAQGDLGEPTLFDCVSAWRRGSTIKPKRERHSLKLYQRRRSEEFIASGLCSRCGRIPLHAETQMCQPCLERTRLRQRKRRGDNKKRSRCVQCSSDMDRTGTICRHCLIQRKEQKGATVRWCPECGERPAVQQRKRCEICAARMSDKLRYRHRGLREQIIQAYGGRCVCCGETVKEFLHLDHVDGGGVKHRKQIGGGSKFYRWVIAAGFPKILQLLCANCNLAKGSHGECPHERQRREALASVGG